MNRITAIAKLMVAEILRMKIAVVVIFFLAILVVSLPFILETDDTQAGHVKITLTYSMTLLMFLLSLLTVFLSAYAVSSKIKGKELLIMDTKPARRWEIILGKWLGIMALNLGLVAVMGFFIWGLVRYIARPAAGSEKDQTEVHTTVLTARRSRTPQPPDISEKVDKEYRRRLKEGRLPEDLDERDARQWIAEQIAAQENVVTYGYSKRWVIHDIKPKKGGDIFIKYKASASSAADKGVLWGRWRFGKEYSDNWIQIDRKEVFDSPHEFRIPADVVTDDGRLIINFENRTLPYRGRKVMAIFSGPDSLIALYRSGSFGMNFVKALLLILIRLGFLAALGVVFGSLFSFQVAAYILIVLLLCSAMVGIVREVIRDPSLFRHTHEGDVKTGEGIFDTLVVRSFYKGIFLLVPDLHKYNPINLVSTGSEVSWSLVGRGFAALVLLKAGIISLLGWYFFNKKELAAAAV